MKHFSGSAALLSKPANQFGRCKESTEWDNTLGINRKYVTEHVGLSSSVCDQHFLFVFGFLMNQQSVTKTIITSRIFFFQSQTEIDSSSIFTFRKHNFKHMAISSELWIFHGLIYTKVLILPLQVFFD